MDFAGNVPLNSVSFGQVSMAWLREIQTRSLEPSIFPIGGQVDLSSQEIDKPLQEWLQNCINKSLSGHDRKIPTIKLWHLNGSLESFSEKQVLFSFYEVDEPTPQEVNIARNHTTVFSSKHTCDAFRGKGVYCHYVPLVLDSHNFKRTNKKESCKRFGL